VGRERSVDLLERHVLEGTDGEDTFPASADILPSFMY
jgi:hypothetical protein